MITPEECKILLSRYLKKSRYQHSLAVSEQAVYLASLYGVDEGKAQIAGLLHDIAKNLSQEQSEDWVKQFQIVFDPITQRSPTLWHAVLGEGYCKYGLSISDEEILAAIRYHTTGRAQMSKLEKIVYLADYTSADRTFPDAKLLRQMVKKDLEGAMLFALEYTICSLAKNHSPIHPDSICAYNELV